MPTRRIVSLRALPAAIALALSHAAFAQTAPAPQAEPDLKLAQASASDPKSAPAAKKDGATAVEQIVVTARRREELIQDVPGAVTAFSGAAIEQAGIQDVTGIADLVPNTTLKT